MEFDLLLKKIGELTSGTERAEYVKKFISSYPANHKIGTLRYTIENTKDSETKKELRKMLIEEIKKKGLVKLGNYDTAEYEITYDSMSEGLEPIYFWTLDFMRDSEPSGLGLDVSKTEEAFEASAASGYFGEMGARASIMEDRAMKILGLVNTVIRTVINLIYDLKEFEIRLNEYDKLKSKDSGVAEGAELAVRSIWMDQVDIKKGRGSINMMAQQLQFVTLRDAFMQAKDVNDVDKIDLNIRVKNILKRKISEYLEWRKLSEAELRKRFNIEKAYLKAQVDSLKLYTKWAKPYLKAAQRLGMKDFSSPDIVAAFNNMQMELSLFGKKEISPGSAFESYSELKFNTKYYACLEVNFKFRTVPQSLRTQSGTHYVHTGTTNIRFRAYALNDEELKELDKQELYEDMELIEHLTEVSLKELMDDLDHFDTFETKEKNEKKPFKLESPFGNPFKAFTEIFGSIKSGAKFQFFGKEGYKEMQVRKKAEDTALKNALVAYDIYKKAHGMITW